MNEEDILDEEYLYEEEDEKPKLRAACYIRVSTVEQGEKF